MSRIETKFRFLPLQRPRSRWRSFVLGFVMQLPLFSFLAAFPGADWAIPPHLDTKSPIKQKRVQVAWMQPAPEPVPEPVAVTPRPRLKVPVELPPPAKLALPALPPLPEPVSKAPLVASLELPHRLAEKQSEQRPQPIAETAKLTGSSAAPTLPAMPSRRVQTGGFGDPNGVELSGPPAGGKLTVASVGNFDLPAGGGYGNGTGGARGVRGVVPSAGFGNGTATEPRPAAQPARVQTTNFTPEMESAKPTKKAAGPVDVPVAIHEKPTPVYTAEARELHLEGEVLLQVVFTAGGRVQVVRLLRGLGHGLDEAAMRAAEKIRFTPAQRDHQPVDTVATLHIVFQLS